MIAILREGENLNTETDTQREDNGKANRQNACEDGRRNRDYAAVS